MLCGCCFKMVDNVFNLTDKIEFVPDKDLEGELNFNLRAAGYVFNKTLEYSVLPGKPSQRIPNR